MSEKQEEHQALLPPPSTAPRKTNYIASIFPPRHPAYYYLPWILLSFILITASFHSYNYLTRPQWEYKPPPDFCPARQWISINKTFQVSPHDGLSIAHRQGHFGNRVQRRGTVSIEGTDTKEIVTTVTFRTTSLEIADNFEIQLSEAGNEIVLITDEDYTEVPECLALDVKIELPSRSSIPFLNLSFLYSSIHFRDSVKAQIRSTDLSTKWGLVTSETWDLNSDSTIIKLDAGSASGLFTLRECLDIDVESGGIDIRVDVDKSIESPKAVFKTRVAAGNTHVELIGPLEHRNQIYSMHKARAGGINLDYPEDWEGQMEADTHAGTLEVDGKGLRIVEVGWHLPGQYVRAIKGKDFQQKCKMVAGTDVGRIGIFLTPVNDVI